jgi:uncharacterized damage-inducible protein DinB
MTLIQIGIERNVEGRTLAWALDYPGVFTYGADDAEALIRIPRQILTFESWLNLHTDQPWVQLEGLDMHIDETFEVFSVKVDGSIYEVNAFFRSDLVPLSDEEVSQALRVYNWQREELLAGVETLPPELLKREFDGQRWTIEGILKHIARVEPWYFSRLGFEIPQSDGNSNAFQLLDASAKMTNRYLPELLAFDQVFEHHQEKWSARKLVRRLLWHQRDHIDHIRELALDQIRE